MLKLGINPWVAHFFVFFLSVWGELSPPTSLAAAVSARIANTSFMRTMWVALKICLPITLMTFALFTRSDLVVQPGWRQIGDILLVTTSTCGVAFAMFGRCFRTRGGDVLARAAIALLSFVTLYHPDDQLVRVTGPITLLALIWAVWRHGLIAPPMEMPVLEPEPSGPLSAEDLARARRDVG
jgi:TRAP-type uncharacterized transport system fused permease subunit